MFNNLIESSSHAGEFKRRGSFVLITTATYVLFFIVAGVASIYAYDARLEDQNTEFVTMLNPVELSAAPAAVAHNTPPGNHSNAPTQIFRNAPTASLSHPEMMPDHPSAEPNRNPTLPDGVRFVLGDHDSGPVEPGGTARTGTGGTGGDGSDGQPSVDIGTPPPPQPPIKRSPPPIVSKGVITGLAKLLPKPSYPPIARQAGAHGPVSVQVLIDENGKVISAKAVSGHPLLLAAAQQAAYQARFSPTRLSEEPVKVSGVITYNFVLQ